MKTPANIIEKLNRNQGVYETREYRYILSQREDRERGWVDEVKRTKRSNLGTMAMYEEDAWEHVCDI